MNEEFGMPEDSLMSDLRMIHEGSHREETPQLLFS